MANKRSLPAPIKGITFLEVIGEGSFGVVYKAKWKGQTVAAKQLKKKHAHHENTRMGFNKECHTSLGLDHKNIVKMFSLIKAEGEIPPVLIGELLHCDLETYLSENAKPLHPLKVVNITLDVAEGLQYLHSLRYPLAHRDLASKNILLAKNGQAKITDLGLARLLVGDTTASPIPGTLAYAAPETFPSKAARSGFLLKPTYDVRVDVFSFGVLQLEVITGYPPDPYPPRDILNEEGELIPEYKRRKKDISKMGREHSLAGLVLQCLANDRTARLATQEIIEKLNQEKEKIERKVKIAASSQHSDRKLKVIALGASGVGKTCILKRFHNPHFDFKHEPNTVGVDFLWKMVTHNGIAFNLQMIDTCGEERFHSMIPSHLRELDAVLFVFDVNKLKTLEKDIPYYMQLLSSHSRSDVTTVLIGNKVDKSCKVTDGAKHRISKAVITERAKAFACTHSMPYIETSAKTGHNVEQLFEMLVERVYDRLALNDIETYCSN